MRPSRCFDSSLMLSPNVAERIMTSLARELWRMHAVPSRKYSPGGETARLRDPARVRVLKRETLVAIVREGRDAGG